MNFRALFRNFIFLYHFLNYDLFESELQFCLSNEISQELGFCLKFRLNFVVNPIYLSRIYCLAQTLQTFNWFYRKTSGIVSKLITFKASLSLNFEFNLLLNLFNHSAIALDLLLNSVGFHQVWDIALGCFWLVFKIFPDYHKSEFKKAQKYIRGKHYEKYFKLFTAFKISNKKCFMKCLHLIWVLKHWYFCLRKTFITYEEFYYPKISSKIRLKHIYS